MKRFEKWVFTALAAFVLATAVPVLALRWLPVPSSAVMLQRTFSEDRPQADTLDVYSKGTYSPFLQTYQTKPGAVTSPLSSEAISPYTVWKV